MNGAQLAEVLGVSRARVQQYVAQGKLDGCFTGEGRGRRFDLDQVAARLGRALHPGQMLGNGAGTKRALQALNDGSAPQIVPRAPARVPEGMPQRDGELPRNDPDRYELARTQKAEEEARRLRRENQLAEGSLVLASEVERQVARRMAQELAEVDNVLRDAARRLADTMGVEFRAARKVLVDTWRAHRAGRAEALDAEALAAKATDAELAADF